MTNFQSELRTQGAVAAAAQVEVPHRWEEHRNVVTLYFPETTPDGFRVGVEASDTGVVLTAGRMHVPSFDDEESPAVQVREALKLARDLLGTGMRLRELQVLGVPYRWYLEREKEGQWIVEHEMGLLFWLPPRPSFVVQSLTGSLLPARRPAPDLSHISEFDDSAVMTLRAEIADPGGRRRR